MAESKAREAYEPPRIVRVRLVADEIAVGNCKSLRVGPVGSLVCNNGGVFVNKTIGS
ncbi:MAG TPA: hypothetical protein VIZ31_12010 [Vicinamibacteria bacterium]